MTICDPSPICEIPGWDPWRFSASYFAQQFSTFSPKFQFSHRLLEASDLKSSTYHGTSPRPGILPDEMHLVNLAIGPDTIVSCLLDWTDDCTYVDGTSRDRRLHELWEAYRGWCTDNNIGERATRKLFTVATLSPDSTGYIEVSQKKLSATACRYMMFWMKHIATAFASSHGTDSDLQLQLQFEHV